jgi:hypothetical protein
MTSAREFQQSLPRGGGSSERVAQLYEMGDAAVAALASIGRVTAEDLDRLDRRSRCAVASSHWALCTPTARAALLADEHHFVRSCASISAR